MTANLASRFRTAANAAPPTLVQKRLVSENQAAIVDAAEVIDSLPDGRHKALALTALEEALMWANKAVFS